MFSCTSFTETLCVPQCINRFPGLKMATTAPRGNFIVQLMAQVGWVQLILKSLHNHWCQFLFKLLKDIFGLLMWKWQTAWVTLYIICLKHWIVGTDIVHLMIMSNHTLINLGSKLLCVGKKLESHITLWVVEEIFTIAVNWLSILVLFSYDEMCPYSYWHLQ